MAHWIQVKVILEKMQMIWKCHIKEIILKGEKRLECVRHLVEDREQ